MNSGEQHPATYSLDSFQGYADEIKFPELRCKPVENEFAGIKGIFGSWPSDTADTNRPLEKLSCPTSYCWGYWRK